MKSSLSKWIVTTSLASSLLLSGGFSTQSVNAETSEETTPLVKVSSVKVTNNKDSVDVVAIRGVAKGSTVFIYDAKGKLLHKSSPTKTAVYTWKPTQLGKDAGSIQVALQHKGKALSAKTKVAFSAEVVGKTVPTRSTAASAVNGGVVKTALAKQGYTADGKAIIQPSQNTVTTTSNPYSPSQQVKVMYGSHTYGVKNQKEYDKVMKEVLDAINTHYDTILTTGDMPDMLKYLDNYYAGERNTVTREMILQYGGRGLAEQAGVKATRKDLMLNMIEAHYPDLIANGVSKADLIHIIKAGMIAQKLAERVTSAVALDGKSYSAYEVLFENSSDCDSDGRIRSAVFDALGFDTMIFSPMKGHATMYYKVGSSWYSIEGHRKKQIDGASNPDGGVRDYPTYSTYVK